MEVANDRLEFSVEYVSFCIITELVRTYHTEFLLWYCTLSRTKIHRSKTV